MLVVVAQNCVVAGGGGSPIDSTRLAATGRDHQVHQQARGVERTVARVGFTN